MTLISAGRGPARPVCYRRHRRRRPPVIRCVLLLNALHGWSIDLIDSDLRRCFGLCMAGFGCGIADRLSAYATKVPLFLVRDPCPAMLFYCGIRVPILPRAREQRDLVNLTKSDAAFSFAQFRTRQSRAGLVGTPYHGWDSDNICWAKLGRPKSSSCIWRC